MSAKSLVLSLSAALLAIITIIVYSLSANSVSNLRNNFTQITAQNGYSSEEHTVTTEDGYLLTVFRIPRGDNCRGSAKRTPVYVMPGLFGCSDAWLDAGPDAGLPYLLADACFDTWVGNTRGNTYGRRHARLNPDTDKEFWEFSADEIGSYDLPATVDYILNKTGYEKVNFIGFSQGGGAAFIMIAEKPEYSEKLGVIIAAAPATSLVHLTSLFSWILETSVRLEHVLNKIGIYEVYSNTSPIQRLAEYFCRYRIIRDALCRGFVDTIDTPHPGSIADDTIETMYTHFPAGTSTRTMARYGQINRCGLFQKYDFGEEENLKVYGSERPPTYDLASVAVPTVVLQGLSDTLVAVEDSEWLAERLPNFEELYIIKDPLWNHLDILYSRNINESMFPKINQYLLKYDTR